MKMRSVSRVIAFLTAIVLSFGIFAGSEAFAASGTKVTLKINGKTFTAKMENNKSAKALVKRLPKTYKMKELNGNEKYRYLKKSLPSNEKKVKKIKAGDIMLYGDDCLVVFYKSFKTSYKYTKLGHITNTKGLKKAVGDGSVKIKFKKK